MSDTGLRKPRVEGERGYGSNGSFGGYFRNRRREFYAASLLFTEVFVFFISTSVIANEILKPRL